LIGRIAVLYFSSNCSDFTRSSKGGRTNVKRFSIAFLFLISILSTAAVAQRAEVAFTIGAAAASNAHISPTACPLGITCLSLRPETITATPQVFLEGTVGFRLVKAKVASLHLEVPVAGVPNQSVGFSNGFDISASHLSSLFITPSIKAKLLPGAAVSPWVSVGGGWAHFSFPDDHTNKAALQFGGGVDIKSPFPHFSFRAEIRDFLSGQPSFGTPGVGLIGNAEGGLSRHNVLAGGGLVVHF
jgi:hypothetical protein